MTAPAAAPAARGHLPSLAAVIATAAVFGLTYSLSAALIALDLAERGAPRSLIGINAAMHALGVLAIAPVLPRVVGRIGPRRMTLGALVVAAIVLALFPAMPGIWLWFPLRFLLGAASEALFTLSETWVNQLSEERSRARSMATYVAALSVGFALGPLILSAVGSAGATPYLIGAGLALAAALLIASPRVIAPVFPKERPGNLLRLLRLAPVAIAAEGLNAGHRDRRAHVPAALRDRPGLDRGGRNASDLVPDVRGNSPAAADRLARRPDRPPPPRHRPRPRVGRRRAASGRSS